MDDRNADYSLEELEQFRRIGEVFFAAAGPALNRLRRTEPSPVSEPPPILRGTPADLVTDPVEKQILQYLRIHVQCSRRELRAVLGLSTATVARKMTRLRVAGLVVTEGSTNRACYSLRGPEGEN